MSSIKTTGERETICIYINIYIDWLIKTISQKLNLK